MSAWESAYFLLFGRQLSRGGGVAEIWLKAKLPSTGAFSCQEADFYSMVEFKVRWAVSQAAAGGPGTPESIASAQVQGIQALRGWVEEIVECCDLNLRAGAGCSLCSWAMDDVLRYFASGGEAEQDSITLLSAAPSVEDSCLCATDYSPQSLEHTGEGYWVESHTAVNEFEFYGEAINVPALYAELQELAGVYASNGIGFYGAITDNAVFCALTGTLASRQSSSTPTIDEIEGRLRSSEAGVWIHIAYSDEQAYLLVKVQNIGGNILEDCNDYPQYCSSLSCVMDKLNSNQTGFFVSEVVNTFCLQNKVDLVCKLGGTSYWGSTSTLQQVLKSGVVTIKLNPDLIFKSSKFCNKDSLRYLTAAETILHESVHAMLVRLAAKAGSREKVTFLGYGQKYLEYKQQVSPEDPPSLAIWYTDHSIILDYYFDKIVSDLRAFNDNYLTKTHYKYKVWSFSYKPSNYTSQSVTGKTESDLYWNYHIKLKNKESFPCCIE